MLTDIVADRAQRRGARRAGTGCGPGVRVVFMSGYADEAVLERKGECAEAEFIQKPFTVEALTTKIRDVLAHT